MLKFNIEEIENFSPRMVAVGTFLLVEDKILLLQRAFHKPQGGTWGQPAGKVESGESSRCTARRELQEETGLSVWEEVFEPISTAYVRYDDYDFVYETFILRLPDFPRVQIDPKSHIGFMWTTPQMALSMNLIQDMDEVIKHTFNLS